MWQCPKCNGKFNSMQEKHKCSKAITIDQYINEQDEDKILHLKKVRECIKNAAPNSTEKISWQMPTFWQGENLVHFAAHKNHLGFYPGDLSLAPFMDKLKDIKHSKGAIQFPYDEIDYALIDHITRWRVSATKKKN